MSRINHATVHSTLVMEGHRVDEEQGTTYWENFRSVFSQEPSVGVSGLLEDEAMTKTICR